MNREPIRETGLLLRDRDRLILQRDEGGRWRFDAPRRAEALLGHRVRIEATRAGYDLLDVSLIIGLSGSPIPPIRTRGWALRLEAMAIMLITLASLLAALL